MRLWKIVEESQLIFRGGGTGNVDPDDLVVMEGVRKKENRKGREETLGGGGGSIDVVAMVDEELFLSGGDAG